MLIKCPNPQCGKRIPSYSDVCQFCQTKISPEDRVPIVEPLVEKNDNENRDDPSHRFPPSPNQPHLLSVTYPELVPFNLSGAIRGTLGLSPKHIRDNAGGPFLFASHAVFKFDLQKGSHSLHQGAYELKVFRGGLEFPNLCPVCLKEPDHVEFFESTISRRGMGKVTFTAKPELKRAIATALCCDRYWYAVPFSAHHGKSDKAIGFGLGKLINSGRFIATVRIKNRTYAEAFKTLNHLDDGRWISDTHKWIASIGFLAFVLGLSFLALQIFFSEQSLDQLNSITLGVTLVVIFGSLITYYVGMRGERF